jgi:uncharacterized damage-inducible protein DinB
MNTTLIATLIGYNAWRNALLLNSAAGLSSDALFAPTNFPSGSLGGTLIHCLGAERIWTERLTGAPTTAFPSRAAFPDLDAIIQAWEPIGAAFSAFALGCTESDLARVFEFRRLNGDKISGVVAELLLQVVNHGTQHGAEAAQMLTDLGRSPGELDLIRYTRQRDALGSQAR